tara:strand:+ start:441 stop:1064 length:624 start_codon:yes stop_codon:yes gene_type:complete
VIKNPHIGIAGNIGVGKTTMTEKLASIFDWKTIYESVVDNPYLADFYDDMDRWSFNLQVYFLYHRFTSQVKLTNIENGFIQDRTIYEDKEIFARNLKDLSLMSKRDWETYSHLFDNLVSFLRSPDLIIYLKASTDTLLSRITKRNRDFEKKMDPEYLHSLNIYYDKWISKLNRSNTLIIETDNFNIFEDQEEFLEITKKIESKLIKL